MLVEFALLGREQRLISAEHRFLGICTGGMIAETNPLHRRKDWWSWRP